MTETTTSPETGVDESDIAPEMDAVEQPEAEIDREEEIPSDEDAGEEDSDDDEESESALIDIEHDGKNYKVPAALKNAFLRNADYTRKTQALAESRRSLESDKQELAASHAAMQEHLTDYAKLKAIGDQIAQYENLDWASVARQNPQLAQQAFQGLTQLKQLGGSLAAQLQQKQLVKAIGAEREHASRIEQGRSVLSREIPDWSPALGGKLVDFAVDAFGFAPHEVGAVMDPRMIKVLHTAYQSHLSGESATRVKHIQAAQLTRPVTEVKAGAGTQPKDPARMSHAEYRRWRNRAQT